MTDNARQLRDTGRLRSGSTLVQTTDGLWTFSSPELYEPLALRPAWSLDQYGRFVADAMIEALP